MRSPHKRAVCFLGVLVLLWYLFPWGTEAKETRLIRIQELGQPSVPSKDLSPELGLIDQTEVAASSSVEIPFEITSTDVLGLNVLFAPFENIEAGLINPAGDTVDSLVANDANEGQGYLSLRVNEPKSGMWKLQFENKGEQDRKVSYAIIWSELRLETRAEFSPSPDGDGWILSLSISDDENIAALSGATVLAKLFTDEGQQGSVELFDDGKHGDGEAGDGVYANSVEAAAKGSYIAVVTATLDNLVGASIALQPEAEEGHTVYLPLIAR